MRSVGISLRQLTAGNVKRLLFARLGEQCGGLFSVLVGFTRKRRRVSLHLTVVWRAIAASCSFCAEMIIELVSFIPGGAVLFAGGAGPGGFDCVFGYSGVVRGIAGNVCRSICSTKAIKRRSLVLMGTS